MKRLALTLSLCLAGCGSAPPAPGPEVSAFRLVNARDLEGRPVTLEVRDGTVVATGTLAADVTERDVRGATLVPAFIDAHVHLSFWEVADEHALGGIALAVDLGAPSESLSQPPARSLLTLLRSGPMITAEEGYPLDSWGRPARDPAHAHSGFGTECHDPPSCATRAEALVAAGAEVLKVPLEGSPTLDDASLVAIAEVAHRHGRLLFAHALSDADALRARRVGADVLAHTPLEALSEETIRAWEGHAVVTTLAAFRSATAIENLARLRERGVAVLYGSDLGNTRQTGIDPDELDRLVVAGLDARAIVLAATETPRDVLSLPRHGALEPGCAASFLLYEDDVQADPRRLASPSAVVLDGVSVRAMR